MDIKSKFYGFCEKYSKEKSNANTHWEQVQVLYTHKNRHYHNLQHLENMFHVWQTHFPKAVQDSDLLSFSIFYHDIIYNAKRTDNEARSAKVAVKVLQKLEFSEERIKICSDWILATKHHVLPKKVCEDAKILIDLDLEVLSWDWPAYQIYSTQIRQEYWIYPDFLYKPGRKKALAFFLERAYIYQTDLFRAEKEEKARENLLKEIKLLS